MTKFRSRGAFKNYVDIKGWVVKIFKNSAFDLTSFFEGFFKNALFFEPLNFHFRELEG